MSTTQGLSPRLAGGVRVLLVEVAQQRVAQLMDVVDQVHLAALPTPLPGAPDVVEGLLDVRGEVLPVVELRRRFGLTSRPVQATDCLVVVQVDGQRLALRVDAVVTLTDLELEELATGPSFQGATYVAGTGLHEGDLLVVLDAARFLTEGEVLTLRAALGRRERPQHG
jgi:purine-binding chemotaxis protein CheW